MPEMSAEGAILVLDLGTSRIKASLFSAGCRALANSSADYPTYAPAPGLAEQSTVDWWAAAVRAVRALWECGYDSAAVRVISVTGQMHGVVPIGEGNAALGPCLTLRDRRASSEAAYLRETIGTDQIYRISGARLDASSPPAKMLWYKRHDAELWAKTRKFLAPKDWLRQQLTGEEAVTDPVEAAGMVIYDVTCGAWSPIMAKACETPISRLPRVCSSTDFAGVLTRAAAQAFGVSVGCPVVVGAADDVEFIGAGLLHPGDCLEHLGSTGSLLLVVDSPVDDPTGTLELYPHLLPGRWLIGGSTSSAGAALDWLRATLERSDALHLPDLNAHEPPIFVPYLAGERSPIWEPDARAVFWGLSMAHRQPDLVRAAFEGVAFSLRHLLDVLCSLGTMSDEIRVVASHDAGWLNLRASVYERPLRVLDSLDPTALGAALIGACALNVYADLEQAARAATPTSRRIEPGDSAALRARYADYLKVSSLVRHTLRDD